MFNNQHKYNIFYWIHDRPLLDKLITFRIPRQSMSFSQVLTEVLLHYTLMVYVFFRNFKSFWNYKYMFYMMIFLIIITMLTNNSCIFCSSFSIFALWLVKWWLRNSNLNNIYVPLFFFTLLMRLNWQVYCRGNFLSSSKIKLQNSLFIILFHCQKGKKTQQICNKNNKWIKLNNKVTETSTSPKK